MTRSQATPASSQMITMARMIEERDETIAAQSAVIEKLREAVAYVHDINDSYQASKCVQEVLATPTDSKEVLKAWLDEVLGEPVGWMFVNEEGECEQIDYGSESPLPGDDGFKPFFKKPAL